MIPPPPAPPTKMAAPPPMPNVKALSPIKGESTDKEQQQRMRSNMLILSGSAATNPQGDNARTALDQADKNTAFTSNVLAATKAETAKATRLSKLSSTIAQGKIIDAVMESAVNTDLPGPIRAIVSRDIYAESGRTVMIPKGSRLIGTYNSDIDRGQVRVLIVWTRLIRPDGLDIEIASPAVDALGRAGVRGIADNKYAEVFSAAFLTSIISIGVGLAVDAVEDTESTTTNNTDGSSTSTGGAASSATTGAVQTIGGASRSVVDSLINIKPTITIDQGSRVNVFVNRDLIFPTDVGGGPFVQ